MNSNQSKVLKPLFSLEDLTDFEYQLPIDRDMKYYVLDYFRFYHISIDNMIETHISVTMTHGSNCIGNFESHLDSIFDKVTQHEP